MLRSHGTACAFLLLVLGCGSSSGGGPTTTTTTGTSCTQASECFAALDGSTLSGGPAACLDKVPNGYCTHACNADTDCCAVPGECPDNLREVCASFESTSQKYCFLSCESSDVAALGPDAGADTYCQTKASPAFGCRSTGGGSNNRKACLP